MHYCCHNLKYQDSNIDVLSQSYLYYLYRCICSLQKKYHIRINTGNEFHVCTKKHDEMLKTVVKMLHVMMTGMMTDDAINPVICFPNQSFLSIRKLFN